MQNGTIFYSTISVIIPVKNNQRGIENLLHSFFGTQKKENYPREIIIVDNNSEPEIFLPLEYQNAGVEIKLLKSLKTGPAAARNIGVHQSKGDWLFFTDSDCVFTETTFTGYLMSLIDNGIAYSGNVVPLKNSILSDYYKQINLLNPPVNKGNGQPAYIVTANCLISREAFSNVGGFNEEFKSASGEDVDLGMRLAKTGTLCFAPQSLIKHDFKNSLRDFYKRFFRYGTTICQLEKTHQITIDISDSLPEIKSVIGFLLTFLLKIAFRKGKNVGLLNSSK